MDSMDMPLTPASFAGLDHKVVLMIMIMMMTMMMTTMMITMIIWMSLMTTMMTLMQQDLEERPLTSLTMRREKATVYDEPPEK